MIQPQTLASLVNGTYHDSSMPEKPVQSSNTDARGNAKSRQWNAVQEAINILFELKYNSITGFVEYRESGTNAAFERLNDRKEAKILQKLASYGCGASRDTFFSVVLANAVEYNPFSLYFEALPAWDGHDYIAETVNRIPVNDEDKRLLALYFRRWLIGVVACAWHNVPNHGIFVLQGEGGCGKTTFMLSLFPPELSEYCVSAAVIRDDKDSEIQFAERFLLNLDELDTATRKESNRIKSMVTNPTVTLRRPYARMAEQVKRTASLCGSVNREDFLHDQTGNRRYLVVPVKKGEKISRDAVSTTLLYAQAKHFYLQGEQSWFDSAENAFINQSNTRFEATTTEFDLIEKWFAPKEGNLKTTTEILEFLLMKEPLLASQLHRTRIGTAMQKAGYAVEQKRVNGKPKRGYAVELLHSPNDLTAYEELANDMPF